MRRTEIVLFSVFVGLALSATRALGDEPKGGAELQNKLIGTWKLVSAKYGGEGYTFPEATTHIKHITPTQFMWATYDQDGKVTRAAGGGYTLKDDVYEETPEYGLGPDFDLIKGKRTHSSARWKETSGTTTAS